MRDLLKNKIFRNTFFLIILAELLSFLGYYYQTVNFSVFFIIIILTIPVSLKRLEYGLYILLTELFIGSFGYLFYFETGASKFSLRLALWLIIMSFWLAKVIVKWLKTRKLSFDFLNARQIAPFIILFIFIGWGLINGLINGNSLSNVFFDFNNWLYFLLIFPVLTVWGDNGQLKTLGSIFLSSMAWLSAKTIFLAYIFTHNFSGLDLEIYGWMRTNGLGEITQTTIGFSRIFMQSQIFILIGFFILLVYLLAFVMKKDNFNLSLRAPTLSSLREIWRSHDNPEICFKHQNLACQLCESRDEARGFLASYLIFLTLFLSAIIISFSRSFWLGLAAGGITVWLIAIFKLKIKLKQFLVFNGLVCLIIIISLAITAAAVKFPYPSAYGGFSATDLLGERLTQITSEAGASSRWQLLPPLWQKIKTAPILGRGFGATVTYRSNDPRVLATAPDGLYTTYAFEWGWLDIWLKLGLFGLLAYLFLLFKIIKNGLRVTLFSAQGRSSSGGNWGGGDLISLSLTTGLVVLAAVNIFSPYLNHPLGIGYIILAAVMIENKINSK